MQTKSGGLLASCILLIISMELKGLGVFWRGIGRGRVPPLLGKKGGIPKSIYIQGQATEINKARTVFMNVTTTAELHRPVICNRLA